MTATVGWLRPGDEELHYSDSSHRWIPPDEETDLDAWRQRVHDHLDDHRRLPEPPPRRSIVPRRHRRSV